MMVWRMINVGSGDDTLAIFVFEYLLRSQRQAGAQDIYSGLGGVLLFAFLGAANKYAWNVPYHQLLTFAVGSSFLFFVCMNPT